MSASPRLFALLECAAQAGPGDIAVHDPDRGTATYSALYAAAIAIARELTAAGVCAGDRVGIFAPKSVGVIAAIFGILAVRASYVPVDPTAPARRGAFIFSDCTVTAVIVHHTLLPALANELAHATIEPVHEIVIDEIARLDLLVARCKPKAGEAATASTTTEDLAYILYTSGSTGSPKGVMHTHASALSFIDWCSAELAPNRDDRFSSHAPFHFDLSIFDLFVSIKHGATIVVIDEDRGKQPLRLAELISRERISVWYSTPSILRLLVEYGKMEQRDYSRLRLVLYAGEVFPPKHQCALRQLWPHPVYYNLYGPTETNVCTYDRVDAVPPDNQPGPLSIGRVCSGDRARVIDGDRRDVAPGSEGELIIAGGSVMQGYWNLPDRNTAAFVVDTDRMPWYRTGDIVIDDGSGRFLFLGRRDRMVKRRGYRVELGEIEATLHRHPHITEAAVTALTDADGAVVIKAFVNWTASSKPSLIELKSFVSQNLPGYMIPDRFAVLPALPKTSTDKIDYQKLRELA